MMSRLLTLAMLTLSLSVVADLAAEDGKQIVQYELQVFRLDGAFRTEASLSPKIRQADRERLDRIAGAVTLFDQGQFDWNDEQLKLNNRGCFWNGQKLTFEEGHRAQLPDGKIKMIYSPTVTKPLGELVRLKIQSDAPFQYMERQPGGAFELRELTLPVGMDLEVRAQRNADGGFRVDYLEIELRSIGSREQIPGVALPIGKPQLQEWEYKLEFSASPRKGYGILVRPKGTTGAMLIRLAISDSH